MGNSIYWGKKEVAERAVANMKELGFTSHGDPYKKTSGLYYLNHTKAKALLFEICFVDDKDDYLLYKTTGPDAIGKALAEAITGKTIKTSATAKLHLYLNLVFQLRLQEMLHMAVRQKVNLSLVLI